MAGLGNSTVFSPATGDAKIDGILSARHWGDPVVTYSFPPDESFLVDYDASYDDTIATFQSVTSAQEAAIHFALSVDQGPAAASGFAIEAFTAQDFDYVAQASASQVEHLRFMRLDQSFVPTAFAFFPFSDAYGGDVAFNNVDFDAPQAGDYGWFTHLHEIGHALGLSHGHEGNGGKGLQPIEFDEMQFTVMSYRSHSDSARPPAAYENYSSSYAQTYMALDIQALQHLYGVDYGSNSGNTVYSWDPNSGDTLIDGALAIDAVGDEVFMTVWDGGGVDTYDLGAYSDATDLVIDLTPGLGTTLATYQRAALGLDAQNQEILANYSVYNAYMFADDPRSLIENAIAGAGNDVMTGNQADNQLTAGLGADTLLGQHGKDDLIGGQGYDLLLGGMNADVLSGNKGWDILKGGQGDDILNGGNGNDVLRGDAGADRLKGGNGSDRFVFAANSSDGNIIRDFEDGLDSIKFSGSGVTFASTTLTQQGADVLVDFGSSSVLVRRIDVADLTSADFEFS
ncbi:M10 family metallopeptidase C-terminal domain-containing protein [Algirhabdus cladophorae]|uniref:M10 family metallopeptidase C-terminal domain-containing protein n=1 Tax=Algirhabdus cladophorae TaxID=3377108 RepID=UPI003B84B632